MTNAPPKEILPDGTRVYVGRGRRKPVPPEQRKYRKLKPEGAEYDPLAFTWRRAWFRLHVFLPDDERGPMPETRPDEETLEHRIRCMCNVCKRPAAQALRFRNQDYNTKERRRRQQAKRESS